MGMKLSCAKKKQKKLSIHSWLHIFNLHLYISEIGMLLTNQRCLSITVTTGQLWWSCHFLTKRSGKWLGRMSQRKWWTRILFLSFQLISFFNQNLIDMKYYINFKEHVFNKCCMSCAFTAQRKILKRNPEH